MKLFPHFIFILHPSQSQKAVGMSCASERNPTDFQWKGNQYWLLLMPHTFLHLSQGKAHLSTIFGVVKNEASFLSFLFKNVNQNEHSSFIFPVTHSAISVGEWILPSFHIINNFCRNFSFIFPQPLEFSSGTSFLASQLFSLGSSFTSWCVPLKYPEFCSMLHASHFPSTLVFKNIIPSLSNTGNNSFNISRIL